MLEAYWTGVFIVGILGGILGLAATVAGAVMALDPIVGGEW